MINASNMVKVGKNKKYMKWFIISVILFLLSSSTLVLKNNDMASGNTFSSNSSWALGATPVYGSIPEEIRGFQFTAYLPSKPSGLSGSSPYYMNVLTVIFPTLNRRIFQIDVRATNIGYELVYSIGELESVKEGHLIKYITPNRYYWLGVWRDNSVNKWRYGVVSGSSPTTTETLIAEGYLSDLDSRFSDADKEDRIYSYQTSGGEHIIQTFAALESYDWNEADWAKIGAITFYNLRYYTGLGSYSWPVMIDVPAAIFSQNQKFFGDADGNKYLGILGGYEWAPSWLNISGYFQGESSINKFRVGHKNIVATGAYYPGVEPQTENNILWANVPSLISKSIYNNTIKPGDTFTLGYKINNPNSFSLNLGLGASIRRHGTSTSIDDPSNDKYPVKATPGLGWHSREFSNTEGLSSGYYDVAWGLWSWKPGVGSSKMLNWSGWIDNYLIIDGDPPTNPTSFSSNPSAGSWSNDSTVWLEWYGASDALSGIYGYGLWWSNSPGPPAEEVDTTYNYCISDPLTDGTWYLNIKTVDKVGNWADDYFSCGPFYIDTTSPSPPVISSSTHPDEDQWYSDDDPTFTWTTPTDISGIYGYSYILDNSPITIPDTTVDTYGNSKSYYDIPTGIWYFHVRVRDNAGNWGATNHYKVKIDTQHPYQWGNYYPDDLFDWVNDPTPTCWIEVKDENSGLDVSTAQYSYSTNGGSSWSAWYSASCTGIDGTTTYQKITAYNVPFDQESQNQNKIRYRIRDMVGNGGVSYTHNVQIDWTPPPAVSNLHSTSHTIREWSNNRYVDVEWTQSSDGLSGMRNYRIKWDQNPDTSETDDYLPYQYHTTSPALTNGYWYFHIRPVDEALNYGSVSHLGPFLIDITPPETGHTLSGDIGQDEWYRSSVNVQLSATDSLSGVAYTEYNLDNSGWQTYTSSFLVSGEGIHTLSYRSVDNANNYENIQTIEIKIDITPPEEVSALHSTSHSTNTWSNDNTVDISWTPANDATSGIWGYSIEWSNSATTLPDTVRDIGNIVETISNPLSDGNNWYFHIRSVDMAENWDDVAAHLGPFWIDTTPPSAPIIGSPTHPNEDQWYSNNNPSFAWSIPDDLSGVAGYSYEIDQTSTTTPDEVIDTTDNSVSYSGLSTGVWYFHVRARDNAGNWGSADHYTINIDITPPDDWNNFVPLDWVNDQTPNCTIQVKDDHSGLRISTAYYSYSTDGGITWSDWEIASCTGIDGTTLFEEITASNVPFNQDSDYDNKIQFKIEDMTGNEGISPVYTVKIDTIPPGSASNLYSLSHEIEVWNNDNTIDVTWTSAEDHPSSGLAGYSIEWNHLSDYLPDKTMDIGPFTSITSPPLDEGNDWYFHIRSVDNAGNWDDEAVHLGPFWVDATPPVTTHSIVGTEGNNEWYVSDVDISLSATDGGCGVQFTRYSLDESQFQMKECTHFHISQKIILIMKKPFIQFK